MSPKERAREHIRNVLQLMENSTDLLLHSMPPKEFKRYWQEREVAIRDRLMKALVEIEEGNA